MNKPFLVIPCKENKIEKVRQLTQILCILSFQDVTGRELDLLCQFIYNGGVNDKARKSFMLTYKTSAANYGQIVKRLSDKNILFDKPSRTGKIMHKDFEELKKYYIDNTEPNILAIKVV
jgi:hypothetical protein